MKRACVCSSAFRRPSRAADDEFRLKAMPRTVLRTVLIAATVVFPGVLWADEQADYFRQKVEPILRRYCYDCHSHEAGQMENGLALDWRSGWATGGDRGPAIVPGKPQESLLIRAVEHRDPDLKMPEEKLDTADIDVLVEWVRQGALDDRVVAPNTKFATGNAEAWWSLKPLVAPPIPASAYSTGDAERHAIDAFVDSRLAAAGLLPSPEASPRELIRRLYFDLIGLPPSPEEVVRFEADHGEAAYLQLVDQLLASPRYGERWARHWFDTIHFADSHGYEHDVGRDHVWHYHFGRGLCDTPSDFGRMGGVPSHPELIDWLAVWFRDEAGGSLKKLHRLIVTSRTYRQTSELRPDASLVDSDNRLLWRQNGPRLDADAYRDFVLAVSGRIDYTMGGPAIQHFHQSPGAQLTPKLDYAAYDWGSPGSNRRGIYRYVWRGIPDPLMSALDFPDLGLLTPTRGNSVSPLQAIALFNNNFVLFHSQEARGLAQDTLVIWTTEFGRTPFAQGSLGRDHNGGSFVTWLWGAGIKPGVAHGRSDDWGYQAVENKTWCHDLHASVLHLLGIDHTRLSVRQNGIDRRLTDVHGHVVKEILA